MYVYKEKMLITLNVGSYYKYILNSLQNFEYNNVKISVVKYDMQSN